VFFRFVNIYFALERQDHDPRFQRILSHQNTEQWQQLALILNSVVDPHHIDADPDSTYYPDADSDFCLMRFRIRLFTLMRTLIQILASKEMFKHLKKCSNRLIFWLVICKLMRILMRIYNSDIEFLPGLVICPAVSSRAADAQELGGA
jgi:hypothetical protein